jgi:hypothetical protein
MLDRWFLEHPRSVGETYFEHMRAAFSFSAALFVAALACAVHALAPALHTRTGSRAVTRLHDRMVSARRRAPSAPQETSTEAGQPWADYAI